VNAKDIKKNMDERVEIKYVDKEDM